MVDYRISYSWDRDSELLKNKRIDYALKVAESRLTLKYMDGKGKTPYARIFSKKGVAVKYYGMCTLGKYTPKTAHFFAMLEKLDEAGGVPIERYWILRDGRRTDEISRHEFLAYHNNA